MDTSFSDFSAEFEENNANHAKKRKKTGRLSEVMKKLRATSNEVGSDCCCKRHKCFDVISPEERNRIIKDFNNLGEYNRQNEYLGGLITILPVVQRRSRKDPNEAKFNDSSYSYRLRSYVNGALQDIAVCYKAFLSIHGISNRRGQTIKKKLLISGVVGTDNRGKHSNRPHKLSDETKTKVFDYIKSLKGIKSHYSPKDSEKIYLSEELNIKKLHTFYKDKHPENVVGYTTFRDIFEQKFNISFGYPRKDTCSVYDVYKSEVKLIENQINTCVDNETKNSLNKTLKQKSIEHELHKKKGDKFYELKRKYRRAAKKTPDLETIVMDYQRNLPTPNITTNDVYYRRQLNFISFNVHVLSDESSIFYTYDETVARKGADDVCSMLEHYFFEILDPKIRQLIIFCDSCAGQNKNYTTIRFFHYMVCIKKRFDSIKMVFPIRGHSYLECDRDMGKINSKSYTELPDDWRNIFLQSRQKPTPFNVIDCAIEVEFKTWTDYFSDLYPTKNPIPTRPIRVLLIEESKPRFINHKSTYHGPYLSAVITHATNKRNQKNKINKNSTLRPI